MRLAAIFLLHHLVSMIQVVLDLHSSCLIYSISPADAARLRRCLALRVQHVIVHRQSREAGRCYQFLDVEDDLGVVEVMK